MGDDAGGSGTVADVNDLADLAGRLGRLPPGDVFQRTVWRECADAGLTGLPFATEWGGRGATLAETAEAIATFGRGGAPPGLVFGLGAQLWSVASPLARFGTDEQRQRWLTALCAGDAIAGHAMTEPNTGSDAYALSTAARVDDDGVVLDGAKTFVTNGPNADLFLVFATSDRAKGWAGISAYLVERSAPGLEVGPVIRAMSPAAAPLAEVVFSGCRVPAANRLGRPGTGMAVFTHAMELERSLLAAGLVGLAEHRLAKVAATSPGAVVAERVAALLARTAAAWSLVQAAAARLDSGRKASGESALAKIAASEAWRAVANLAVDTQGAAGLLAGAEIDLADATAACIYSGTSELQREILGHRLRLP